MSENGNYIVKKYRCNICNKTHDVKLNKQYFKGRTKYPFPYVFLHDSIKNGENKELLTILYIDKDFKIRGAEIQELDNDNLFSKEQVIGIVKPLIEELNLLRKENLELKEELKK
ncbi:MAG: hypothetical protein GF317_14585 [Candidatus Lokiarchaeota archaeon]|nr:hypothetical protein [Candidatus Lokiarchaeota archaeon]MBD3200834.1 hypothetical protein [Candidatus Lokiarchaeota archaeon]